MSDRAIPDGAVFDRMYEADPDPWRFATSDYEREKYAATLAALPDRRVRRGFEIGCSIGVLTQALAPRCDTLLAVDIAARPLRDAASRTGDLKQVTLRRMTVPEEWPDGVFDLILVSEVLYFLAADRIDATARCCRESLASDGIVLAVNFTGPNDCPLDGDAAAERFIASAGLPVLRRMRADRYRIDMLGSAGTGTVAG